MSTTNTTANPTLLDRFAGVLDTGYSIYRAERDRENERAIARANATANATNQAAANQNAINAKPKKKDGAAWYKAPWVIPAAIGVGVLVLFTLMRRR